MYCNNCRQEINENSIFCRFCGKSLKTQFIVEPIDKYPKKQIQGCQICGSLAPTKSVEFGQNIGMIFSRQYSQIKGNLCKNCINKEFKKRTLITLFFGWWGTISFFASAYYLISNIINFIPTIGMKKDFNK